MEWYLFKERDNFTYSLRQLGSSLLTSYYWLYAFYSFAFHSCSLLLSFCGENDYEERLHRSLTFLDVVSLFVCDILGLISVSLETLHRVTRFILCPTGFTAVPENSSSVFVQMFKSCNTEISSISP